MPAAHDLDPIAMTESERLEKRRFEAGFVFEMPRRHPVTGRFLAFDCEVDCLEHCAGLCGNL